MKSSRRSTPMGLAAEPHSTGKHAAMVYGVPDELLQLLLGGLLPLQVLLEELVVALHDVLHELDVAVGSCGGHVVGNGERPPTDRCCSRGRRQPRGRRCRGRTPPRRAGAPPPRRFEPKRDCRSSRVRSNDERSRSRPFTNTTRGRPNRSAWRHMTWSWACTPDTACRFPGWRPYSPPPAP